MKRVALLGQVAFALAALVASVAFEAGCDGEGRDGASSGGPRLRAAPVVDVLRAPRAAGPIKLDGELTESDWLRSCRTGAFVDAHGEEARPFSEARFLWDDKNLYVSLYAADDDIRAAVTVHDGAVWTDDAFSLHITPVAAGAPTYLFDISATGVVTDAKRPPGGAPDVTWESGIALGVDRDGSVNDAGDEDEEWVIEAAIPLEKLGLAGAPGTRFSVEISRCDTPRAAGSRRRCGSYGAKGRPRMVELSPDG